MNSVNHGLLHQIRFVELLSDFGCHLLGFCAFDLKSWYGEREISFLQLLGPLELRIDLRGILAHNRCQHRADVFPISIYGIQVGI